MMDSAGGPLPDVFVSYARTNRPLAEQLADALSASGLQVWWDSDLSAGAEFAAVIEAKLLGAAVVIVMWSADSVRSAFVRDECSRALKQGKLLPVRIEDIELPLGFGQLHTLDLLEWEGDADDAAFQKLLFEVRRRKQQAPADQSEPSRPSRRWPRRSTLLAVAALALAVAGATVWYVRDQQDHEAEVLAAAQTEADRHFRAGLDLQYADVPQLEKALNEYLSAIELRPGHARAHYYLGHVYAQTGKLADALVSFRLALTATEAPLDRGQRAEADKQVLALAAVDGEEAPVTRRATNPDPATPPVANSSAAGTGAGSGTQVAMAKPPAPRPAPPLTRGSPRPLPIERPPVTPRPGPAPAPVVEVAVKQPPRIDPPEASIVPLTKSVEALFDENKESRISATTSLVLDPQALSDAVPLAVNKGLQLLKGGTVGLGPSASSGVANTLVLLQSALPGTLQVNRATIEQLLDAAGPLDDYTAKQADKVRELLKQAQARNPVAYIQIANEAQRPIAETLATKLRSFGYEAPGIEMVGERAPESTQVRVQGKSDRSYARWVRKAVAEAINGQPAASGLRNAKPRTDTYEIWFGRQLCAPGGRMVAGCKPA